MPNALAGFAVTRDDTVYAWPESDTPSPDSGLIARWEISNPFPEPEELTVVPAVDRWREVSADAAGRVNVARWAGIPAGASSATVLARTRLHADRARVVRLGFGFSDRGTVFLNGQPVFRGDNTYLSRSKRYLGVMGVDNDVIYLPLRAGANELVFAVSESFGGWGVTARLIDREGVRLAEP